MTLWQACCRQWRPGEEVCNPPRLSCNWRQFMSFWNHFTRYWARIILYHCTAIIDLQWYLLRSPGCLERILSTQASESRSEREGVRLCELSWKGVCPTLDRGGDTNLRGRDGATRARRLHYPEPQPAANNCWRLPKVELKFHRIGWYPVGPIGPPFQGKDDIKIPLEELCIHSLTYISIELDDNQIGPNCKITPEELHHHSRESIGRSNGLGAVPSGKPGQMWC